MNQHLQTSGELKAARAVADKLMLAVKNTAFYPAEHAVVRESHSGLFTALSAFMSQYGPLVLEVHKSYFDYAGQPLSLGTELHETLAYTCYRDGIQFLSFSENLGASELEAFVRILASRRLLEDENEGDVVTDLWEAGFAGIRYATNNKLWQDVPLLDFSSLKIAGQVVNQSGLPEGEAGESLHPDPGLWRLEPEEIEATRRMVEEEELRHFDQDVFDIFLVMLREQRDREDFVVVLEILRQCFQRTLSRGEFRSAGRFLANLRRVRSQYDEARHWAMSYLDDFLLMISGMKDLSPLQEALRKMNDRDGKTLRDLKELLVQLSPEAVLALGQMLIKIRSVPTRQIFTSAVMRLSARDPRPLYQLARNPSPAVARQAIAILGRMEDRVHIPTLVEAARSALPAVRIAGIEALLLIDPPEFERLLPFMFDADERVRDRVFAFLAAQRRPDIEAAILEYLRQETFAAGQRRPLLLLYQALGRCGSEKSIEFLKKRLISRPWKVGKTVSMHRQGAAAALLENAHPGASGVLSKASKTIWPAVRRAVRKAREFRDGNRHQTG